MATDRIIYIICPKWQKTISIYTHMGRIMPRYGYRGGRGGGPGRWRAARRVTAMPPVPTFHPFGVPPHMMNVITLRGEELEAIRLVDFEGLEHEDAAMRMGVSRKTLWNELKGARRKIAKALIFGYAIRIEGGNYVLRGEMENVMR